MTNKERAKARYWRCREQILAQKKGYYQDKKEERIAYQTEWNQSNRGKTRGYFTTWASSHPEERRTNCRNRAARKRAAQGSHTAKEIRDLLEKQNYRCAHSLCDISIRNNYHVDHVMPLVLGGRNDIQNIQLLCPTCNRRKGAKHPDKWALENGMLL